MDFFDTLPISPVFILLIGVVFLLLVIEIVYLVRKHGRTQSSSSLQPSSGQTPPSSQTVVVTPPPSQKGFPWKIVLPIAGVIVLSGVIFGGVYYLQQPSTNQDIRSKASDDCYYPHTCNSTSVKVSCTSNQSGQTVKAKLITHKFSSEEECRTTDPATVVGNPSLPGDENAASCTTSGGNDDTPPSCETNEVSVPDCSAVQLDCLGSADGYGPGGQIKINCNNCNPQPTNTPRSTNTPPPATSTPRQPTRTPTPTATPPSGVTNTPTSTPTRTPTPTITPPGATNTPIPGACINLKLYLVSDGNFFSKELTISDLQALSPGTKVNVTVLGDTQTSSAELSINDSQWKPLPQMRLLPNTALKEYYDSANLFDIANYPNKASFVFLGQVD